MNKMILPLLLLVLVIGLAGCPGRQAAKPALPPEGPKAAAPPPAPVTGEIRVYVPCGMVVPIDAASAAFEVDNPGAKITSVYESGANIVKRLVDKGETADVVISPGRVEMAALEAKGLTAPAIPVGNFELVCIVPANSKRAIAKPEDLKQLKKIAIPSPDVNSVGASAKEALTKLALWEALKPKLSMPVQAIDAYNLVATGKVDAGIAYRNCPLETAPKKLSKSQVKVAFAFPEKTYDKQPVLVAVAKQAANQAAAQAFVTYLSSGKGLQVLSQNGVSGAMALVGGGMCGGNCGTGAACGAHGSGTAACPTVGPAAGKAAPAAGKAAPAAAAGKADITVMAFFPGDEKHAPIRKLVEGLPAKYGERVSGVFVDFTSDEGFKIWHDEKGLACGGLLINDQQTWTYEENGKVKEVSFTRGIDGEWNAADLHGVLKKLLAEKK